MQKRREVREIVLKAIYATEMSGEHADEILMKIIRPAFESNEKPELEFAEKYYLKALRTKEISEEIVSNYLKNWELERLATLDRMILQMGITEFLHFEDIPTKVTINECIEIAKKYSTYKSGKFVNGILDSSLTYLKEQNKIKKTGRGLIDSKI